MCPTPRERTVAKQPKASATSAPAGPKVSTTSPAKGKVGNVNYGFASNGAKGSGPSFNPIGFLELPLFIVLAGMLFGPLLGTAMTLTSLSAAAAIASQALAADFNAARGASF